MWNRAENRNLTVIEASPLKLNFNFKLTGSLETGPVSLSGSSVEYQAMVYSDLYHERGSGVALVYGPGQGGNQYAQSGDASLVDHASQSFSLLHKNEAQGFYTMQILWLASNEARAAFQFTLESIHLLEGSAAASSTATFNAASAAAVTTALGMRLVETSEIIPVGAVTRLCLSQAAC